MASIDEKILGFSLEDLQLLKVIQLKEILKEIGESVGGNKASLVSRLFAYICRIKAESDGTSVQEVNGVNVNIDIPQDCTFTDLLVLADAAVWTTDLRSLPPINFHQLYQYLVERAKKYGECTMKGTVYKKERAYGFFKEGHISDIKVAQNNDIVIVQAKVRYAACECPAGLGLKGEGKCNHVGGLLFCVEDFSRNSMQQRPDIVTCTSKLSNWNVPRNLKIGPAPLPELKIKKLMHGNQSEPVETVTMYDPRAPTDRYVDVTAFRSLYEKLEDCMPASGFFLFHEDPKDSNEERSDLDIVTDESFHVAENVEVNTSVIDIESVQHSEVVGNKKTEKELLEMCTVNVNCINISSDTPIDSAEMEKAVAEYMEMEKIDKRLIMEIESKTKQQSSCKLWSELHKTKLTASNFGKAIKCKTNPNTVIKQILYSSFTSTAMKYGKDNEDNAVNAYQRKMKENGINVHVEKMGLLLKENNTGFGASVDGQVHDITNDSFGCLEVKCPLSRAGLSVEEAVKKKPFCLIKTKTGGIQLNKNHDYFYQIQGQMFVTGLKWTDFVVWFGNDELHIERIEFDADSWNTRWFPSLLNFYKRAFVPELLTKRIQQGRELCKIGQFK